MKNRIVQLTHRYPVLEYFLNVVLYFVSSLLFVLLLVVLLGLVAGA